MKKVISNSILLLLVLVVAIIIARPFRVGEIPNGSKNSCANCHINPAGGGARNDFGTEVENNFLDAPGASGHVQWGAGLAALDSDGDGFTNGEELQDPNGTWTSGSIGNAQFVTNPGDPNDFPVETVIVSSPNGGESFEPGEQIDITWISNLVNNVKLEFTSDNGGNWSEIIASTESDGSFSWSVPDISSSQCKIRISDTESSASDQSNSTFAIETPLNPIITVTNPNGGEIWEAGSSHTITWNSSDVTTVSISFTTNNGTTWNSITTSTSSDGNRNWNLPEDINSDQCKVRISDNDSSVEDESDSPFTIFIPLNPEILLTAPNGGETLEFGTQFEITWTSNDVSSVMIEFSIDSGTSWSVVVDSTESTGSYNWSVPSISSTECKLRVSDIHSDVLDESDDVFTIHDPTGVEENLTFDYALSQNYPNPFNPSTTIKFQLPEISDVRLKIYNSNGELITALLDQSLTKGGYSVTWNGKNELGNDVASGVYIYRLTTDKFVETKQMVLLR